MKKHHREKRSLEKKNRHRMKDIKNGFLRKTFWEFFSVTREHSD
jgi:hypothetical protein